MHELSIAATIVEDVLQFVQTHDIRKVLRVRLAIGEWTCVQPEQLKFCYESITRETPMQDSALEIEAVPAQVKCSECGYEGSPKYWMESLSDAPTATLQCPQCGSTAEAAQGRECAIRTIQYVT
jgi:hydrogenase nickel incorporation protein HypA/HybF